MVDPGDPQSSGAGGGLSALCSITSSTPTVSSCGTGYGSGPFLVGHNGSSTSRILLAASDLGLPTGARVVSAFVVLDYASTAPAGSVPDVQAYAATKPWSSPTWNSTGTASWATPGGDYDTANPRYRDPGYHNAGSTGGARLTITRLVQDWASGAEPNNGLVLRANTETANAQGSVTVGVSPGIDIFYTMPTGSDSGGNPLARDLSDHQSMKVNSADGHAQVRGTLFSSRGVGVPLSLGYTIDGDNVTGVSTSFDAPDLWLGLGDGFGDATDVPDLPAYYRPPGGRSFGFTRTGATTYASPQDLNAQLTVDATQTTFTLRLNDSGITNIYTRPTSTAGDARLVSQADTHNNKVSYAYDGSGNLTTITDTQGRAYTIGYTTGYSPPNVQSVTDVTTGRTATLNWSGVGGGLSSVTDPASQVTTFTATYDGGRGVYYLSGIKEPDGQQTTLTADPSTWVARMPRVQSVTFGAATPSAATYTYGYPSSTKTQVTDPNAGVTTYTQDQFGNIVSTTDPLGHATAAQWSPAGKPTQWTDGLSQVTSFQYDTLRNLTKVTSPAGSGTTRSESFGYPTPTGSLADYRPTSSTDAQNHTTSYSYTTATQLGSVSTPSSAGGTPTYHYQGDPGVSCSNAKPGEVCSTVNGNGNTTSYAYDASGNPVTVTAPTPLGVVHETYDASGRRVSQADGRGVTLYYVYDAMDRLTRVSTNAGTCPAASCVTYVYNGEGWLTSRVDPSGTTSYSYDAQGRALSKNTPTGNTSATYDGTGNLLTYTDPGGTVTYGYDKANRNITVAEPGGSCPASPSFPNATKCTGYGYDNAGHRTSTSYPNGQTITLAYDNAGRELSVTAKNGTTVLVSRTYSYLSGAADTDLRQSVTDQAGAKTTYTYDPMNRVLSATLGASVQSWTYDYDGNRLTGVNAGATTYAAFNAADQLCNTSTTAGGTCAAPKSGAATYTYDGAGNLTAATAGPISAATYTPFNQVASTTTGGVSTPNGYADLDNTERTNTGSTSFINGELGITRQVTGSTAITYTRDAHGNLVALTNGSGSNYYTTDALGSVILITGASGANAASYTYDTWGNTASASGTLASINPFMYSGGYTAANGLVKFGSRYYSPGTGRFLTQDPVRNSINNYAYVSDDPSNLIDPWDCPINGVSGMDLI